MSLSFCCSNKNVVIPDAHQPVPAPKTNLVALPEDVCLHSMSFLSAEELRTVSLVNKNFRKLNEDPSVLISRLLENKKSLMPKGANILASHNLSKDEKTFLSNALGSELQRRLKKGQTNALAWLNALTPRARALITTLDLSQVALAKNDNGAALRDLLPELKHLFFSLDRPLSEEEFAQIAQRYPNLASIECDASGLSDVALASFAQRCPDLNKVFLHRGTRLTSVGIGSLLQSPRLEELGLDYCPRVFAGDFPPSVSLRSLVLEDMNDFGRGVITDPILDRVLTACPNIHRLELHNCNLTDNALTLVAQRTKDLKEIQLGRIKNVTANGVKDLLDKNRPSTIAKVDAAFCKVSAETIQTDVAPLYPHVEFRINHTRIDPPAPIHPDLAFDFGGGDEEVHGLEELD